MIYKILVLLLIIQHSVDAQDPEQLLNEANEQMSKGDLVIADSLLKESLKVDPSFAPAHIGFSELWLRKGDLNKANACLLYTSPSPRDRTRSRMPSSA